MTYTEKRKLALILTNILSVLASLVLLAGNNLGLGALVGFAIGMANILLPWLVIVLTLATLSTTVLFFLVGPYFFRDW
jgi:hypothetical protein